MGNFFSIRRYQYDSACPSEAKGVLNHRIIRQAGRGYVTWFVSVPEGGDITGGVYTKLLLIVQHPGALFDNLLVRKLDVHAISDTPTRRTLTR